MSNTQLPNGWITPTISDIASIIRGVTYKKTESSDVETKGLLPVLRANNIQSGKLIFGDFVYVPEKNISSEQKIKAGDIVVAMSSGSKNIVGKTAHTTINWEGGFGAFCGVLRPSKLIADSFLYFFTQSLEYRNQVSDLSAGVNINNLKPSHFDEINIQLPPFSEQKEIATLLDDLLAQVDTLKTRLDAIPNILKRFRQSVLAAAVSGKLTEEWREKNILEAVDIKKINQLHQKTLENKKKIYVKPKPFANDTDVPKLPDSWAWFRSEELCDLITKGTTPSKDAMFSFGDIPYIKVYNLTFDGSLDFSIEPTFISQSVHEKELSRSKVYPGDVLMNIVGPPLGKVSIVPDSHPEWNINQAISIFRPICGVTNTYLSLCLRDDFLLSITTRKAKATAGQFNLTLEICRDFSVPVPPIEEQTEIVRRVEELFAFADQIEQRVKVAQQRVNHLTQAILAKAFRGELTAEWREQNPDLISGENSAAALLARIQAEQKLKQGLAKPTRRQT